MLRVNNQLIAGYVILAASFAALGLALMSQYGFGYHPCELCIYQRWAFAVVILLLLISFVSCKKRLILLLSALALLVGTSIAAFQFGIEQGWWEGFTACSDVGGAGSLEDLRAQILEAPIVRCDEPTWFFLGLSMAGWNVLYSGGLFLLALASLWKRKSI